MIYIIPLTLVILSVIVLLVFIHSKIRFTIKALLCIFVLIFGSISTHSIDSYFGWPKDGEPSGKHKLVGAYIDELKAVFILVVSDSEYKWYEYSPEKGEPRLYKLEYTKELHKIVQDALGLMSEGQEIEVDFTNKKRRGEQEGSLSDSEYNIFHVLPPPILPNKTK